MNIPENDPARAPENPTSVWNINFIVPVVSVLLMAGAIVAIGLRFAAGPS